MKIKRTFAIITLCGLLGMALAGCGPAASSASRPASGASSAGTSTGGSPSTVPVPASSLPAPADDGTQRLEAAGYTLWYRLVPVAEEPEVVGDLAQYISLEIDEATQRVGYVQFVRAEKDGEEKGITSVFRNVNMGKMAFTIDGVDYFTSSTLLSSQPGNSRVFAYFALPIATGDDASISITYAE